MTTPSSMVVSSVVPLGVDINASNGAVITKGLLFTVVATDGVAPPVAVAEAVAEPSPITVLLSSSVTVLAASLVTGLVASTVTVLVSSLVSELGMLTVGVLVPSLVTVAVPSLTIENPCPSCETDPEKLLPIDDVALALPPSVVNALVIVWPLVLEELAKAVACVRCRAPDARASDAITTKATR